ncbi:MAG TPA: DUF4430 domain-containing protein [Xanthomonadales bacterium]|nr:DUF4430 domain-containing protein [Xanthomonadales bacterium]
MDKRTKKVGLILIGVLVLLIGAAALFTVNNPSKIVDSPTPTIVSEQETQSQTLSYQGEDGKDALSLLKDKATVEQNSSGLVISINDRLAEDKNKEFWAFYVNGKMAEVGPAEYITKDTDKIEWKIERY